MVIIINPHAGGGKARRRWEEIRQDVARRMGPFQECVAPDIRTMRSTITRALRGGETRFVAAGGDGTVNFVVNQLFESAPLHRLHTITIGAIGLGSSNDFHKPIQDHGTIRGVPCRLDFEHAVPHDVGHTTYDDGTGPARVKHWILNASVGTTATGNHLYNQANGIIGFAKRLSASAGMVAAATAALARSDGIVMTVGRDDAAPVRTRVRNLGIVKNPHFTGCLKYDSPYRPSSGDFTVYLLADASLWDTLACLLFLALRGRCKRAGKMLSWTGRRLAIEATTPFPIEGDGEIVTARRAVFSLQPGALQVCR